MSRPITAPSLVKADVHSRPITAPLAPVPVAVRFKRRVVRAAASSFEKDAFEKDAFAGFLHQHGILPTPPTQSQPTVDSPRQRWRLEALLDEVLDSSSKPLPTPRGGTELARRLSLRAPPPLEGARRASISSRGKSPRTMSLRTQAAVIAEVSHLNSLRRPRGLAPQAIRAARERREILELFSIYRARRGRGGVAWEGRGHVVRRARP